MSKIPSTLYGHVLQPGEFQLARLSPASEVEPSVNISRHTSRTTAQNTRPSRTPGEAERATTCFSSRSIPSLIRMSCSSPPTGGRCCGSSDLREGLRFCEPRFVSYNSQSHHRVKTRPPSLGGRGRCVREFTRAGYLFDEQPRPAFRPVSHEAITLKTTRKERCGT